MRTKKLQRHTREMIEKLENAGLGYFIKSTETQLKLGKTPLRQLVYRVLDLPPSMRPLVYDYGQLSENTEKNYIQQIVYDHVSELPDMTGDLLRRCSSLLSEVLNWSQSYMRKRDDECSFVSLRDVERAMIVFQYFYNKMDLFGPLMDNYARGQQRHIDNENHDNKAFVGYKSPGNIARALVLSLSVCYHARLQDRLEYEVGVVSKFMAPIALPGGAAQFRDEIRWCQEVLLDNMQLGDNIARNAALRENVFMMAICVELRIPLFLVGKPGSSKSLAKAIISESMRGKTSVNKFLRNFKEVDILSFSYQCSQLSTPESIADVFKNASKFQENQDKSSYVAVVVLDEVGLAEDSPNLPLKVLHPLLEDGTEGEKKDFLDQPEIISRQERVAFIGISNWALDPAKMNRGVMVTRAEPTEEELVTSARGICSNKKQDPIRGKLEPFFEPFAKAYLRISKLQHREFFGLRDFYSLIKMLYSMCKQSGLPPTWPQLEHAIKRNFGGLESDKLNPFEEFKKEIKLNYSPPDLGGIKEELHYIMNPDCSNLGLIKTSLRRRNNWHGENRYVLFLTENYAALNILKNPNNYLSDELKQTHLKDSTDSSASEPFVLFGSSFPKDQEFTQVCRNINQIKICMETGRTVILLNLGNLYESLYDVLNQYYIYHADNRYVDLGLQSHRVKCRVHNNFRLILIAEKGTVYERFPTPLINRMEKHFVLTSSILNAWQQVILKKLEDWINDFSDTKYAPGSIFLPQYSKFEKNDAFIGFQNDTSASVVFQATNLLRLALADDMCGQGSTQEEWTHEITWSKLRHEYVDVDEEDHETSEEEGQEEWQNAVLTISQHLMLRIAAPEAIVRLEYSPLADKKSDIEKAYFVYQHHKSIDDFLNYFVFGSTHEAGLLMQVTTHSYLLSKDELKSIEGGNKHTITSFFLHEFHSELDFSDKVGKAFYQGSGMLSSRGLVIIQCDSELISGDLIACARYRIYDLRAKAMQEAKAIPENASFAHVLFIIHLSRQEACSSLVGFQGDPWISYHIDDLKPSLDKVVSTSDALKFTVSELFMGTTSDFHSPIAANKIMGHMGHDIIEDPENEDTESEDDFEGSTSAADDYSAPEVCEVETLRASHHEMAASLFKESCCPLYHRLHGCIQSTVSKLNDGSIKRHIKMVKLLLDLIPKKSPSELDKDSFYGILVYHISILLKERDAIREDEKEWVVKEAMNPKSLQHGGTFCNVLSRKFDAIIEPLFRKIIACIDQNCNMNLINISNQKSALSQFWLCMFRTVVKFSYQDMIIQKKDDNGVASRIGVNHFECKLPFSWLIFEGMESQWDNISGDDEIELHAQLCAALDATPIGEVVKNVDESCCNEFYQSYLHDFVRLVHECVHEDAATEYELIINAMYPLVEFEQFYPDDNKATFVQKIAALHVVFQINKSQIMWFGQLTGHCPWILKSMIKEKDEDTKEMILHLCAVNKTLDNLAEPLRTTDRSLDSYLVPWLNEVHTYQTCIMSIISFPSSNNLREIVRMKWEAVRVLQLFLEFVLLKHKFENSVAYFVRLKEKLKFKANFLEVTTLKGVQSHLRQTVREVSSKVEKKSVFRKHCLDYFLSVISTLCFGGTAIPEPALIESLVEILQNEENNLVSFLVSNKSNTFSGFRSSLLQILMEHSSGDVRKSLDRYFLLKSQGGRKWNDTLCLECIQNFEDAMVKDLSDQSREQRIEVISDVLKDSYKVLRKFKSEHFINISYLQGVAKVRFAIMEIAQYLHSHFSHEDETEFLDEHQPSDVEHSLMKLAERVCTDHFINSTDFRTKNADMFGPAIYLLKLLVRLYGFPLLKKVSERYVWVIPEGLRTANLEKAMDPFVIYEDLNLKYSLVRDCVNEEARGKRFHTLDKITKEGDDRILAILPLAIYESVTLSYLHAKYAIDDKIIKEFSKYFQQPTFNISSILLHEIQVLINNKQGGSFSKMSVSPGLSSERKVLGGIVVHTVSVLAANAGNNILLPLYNMLTNPSALVDMYFPTMEEDDLVEVKKALCGRFYACPRGHPYFVGECGLPRETKLCYVCGTKIGGYYTHLQKGNKEARDSDETPKGYALSSAELQSGPPGFLRNLSPQAICVIRAVMHSALLWYCCHNNDWRVTVASLMTAHTKQKNLPELFWNHLQKDIEHLSRLTGKGFEEAALIVHMILSEILTKPVDEVRVSSRLKSKDDRKKWEDVFCAQYIYPVFKDLDDRLNRAIYLITTDEKQDHDHLFCLVYEKGRVRKTATEPQLWNYRQRICLEHLWQTLQEKDLKKKYSILHEFLQAEQALRATRYLPDIVKLQNFLFKKFHHRLDREDAKSQTIGQYLKNNYEFSEAVESLKAAWSLVKIQAHSRLEEKHCLSAITDDVSLEYLIPTTFGAGALTTCLADFLITTHNNFINTCCDLAKQSYQSSWSRQKIPVMFVKQCHLLDYEDQIIPLIMSHSMSSKKLGEVHKVQYDHKAIEKQLLERFIYGRPLITCDIPLVVYRKDVVNTFTFEAIRKKVSPQQELESQLQKDILSELRTPDRLRENLDVIDIVIGFLSSGGGRPDKSLKSYIKKVLKMDVKPFSTKAQDYCSLQHIMSLWRIVSVELSRMALLHGQEPFDTVGDQFRRPLHDSGDSNQVAELEKSLTFFDVDKLIGSLFEFIETHVKYSPDNELSWPIRDILVEDQFKHLGIEEAFSEQFPATVLLDQTVAVWKYLVSYQEKIKQDLK